MVILSLLGCSLTTYDQIPCESHGTCREAFGLNWTCGDEGLCSERDPHTRCTSTWPDDLWIRPEDYRDRVLLASMFDHTTDTPEVYAVRLPVIQLEDQGGLDGTDFAVIECTYEETTSLDGLDGASAASEVSSYLVDELGVKAIIGPKTSGQTTVVYETVGDRDMVVISPSATSPALTTIDGAVKTDQDPGNLWRTAPPDSLQGLAVARGLDARGTGKVVVVYQTGPYGEGLKEVFLESYQGVASEQEYLSASDVPDIATALPSEHPDVDTVFFISSEVAEIAEFLNAAAEGNNLQRWRNIQIFLADGAAQAYVLDNTENELYGNILGSRPSVTQGLVYDGFAASYAATFPGRDSTDAVYTSYAFDATWLAIYGATWSHFNEGEISGLGIARGLRKVSSGEELEIRPTNWNPVKAQFKAGNGIDVLGASGELDFDPVTEETTAPIEIWRIDQGGTRFEVCRTWCWDEGEAYDCQVQDVSCE